MHIASRRSWFSALSAVGMFLASTALGSASGCGDDGKSEMNTGIANPSTATNDASMEMPAQGVPATPTHGYPVLETHGAPLQAPDRTWTYVEFPDTHCRDGSPAGVSVSLNASSKKVMIFLEGGGACFDSVTCGNNPTNTAMQQAEKTAGMFNRMQAANPVKDWNFVDVPYCTGDTHGGTKADGTVDGVAGTQQFVGYLNMQAFLQRIVPTFPDATDVLVTGVSAGGFGAAVTFILVQRAFPNVKVRMIDDSGPPMSAAVIPECLQHKWRVTWGYDQSILADCGASCTNPDDFSQAAALGMAKTFDDRPLGLIESARDSVIAGFYGAGLNNCTGIPLLNSVPPDVFQADLLAYREKVRPYPSMNTYIPDSTQHTWLATDGLYTASAGGVNLIDWVTKIINGENPGHAGP